MSQKPTEAGRRPTPRPDFSVPTVIRRDDAVHHVWGDPGSGFVTDRVLVSTGQLHVLEYDLPPRGEFRCSPLNQTVFAGDVVYFVLEGELILADPRTGEVARVPQGTGRLFHRDTWHEGFNPSEDAVRVLEFFSPPPSRGASSEYARRQVAPDASRYSDPRWRFRWPEARAERDASSVFLTADPATGLLSFRDDRASHLISTIVHTPFLTVVHGTVQPGHVEDFAETTTDSLIRITSGEIWVDVWAEDVGYQATSALRAGDSMFLPAGTRERLLVRDRATATYLRGWGDVPADWVP